MLPRAGLLHALLDIHDLHALLGHPVVGGSREGFVVENLVRVMPEGTTSWFYRTAAGAEIDLLLMLPDGETLWAVEVKRSLSPKASRGFRTACDDVGATRRVLVTPGEDSWPLDESIEVSSLAALMRELVALATQ